MASKGDKELKTSWPKTDGPTFGETRTHKKTMYLLPEKKSLIRPRDKTGL